MPNAGSQNSSQPTHDVTLRSFIDGCELLIDAYSLMCLDATQTNYGRSYMYVDGSWVGANTVFSGTAGTKARVIPHQGSAPPRTNVTTEIQATGSNVTNTVAVSIPGQLWWNSQSMEFHIEPFSSLILTMTGVGKCDLRVTGSGYQVTTNPLGGSARYNVSQNNPRITDIQSGQATSTFTAGSAGMTIVLCYDSMITTMSTNNAASTYQAPRSSTYTSTYGAVSTPAPAPVADKVRIVLDKLPSAVRDKFSATLTLKLQEYIMAYESGSEAKLAPNVMTVTQSGSARAFHAEFMVRGSSTKSIFKGLDSLLLVKGYAGCQCDLTSGTINLDFEV